MRRTLGTALLLLLLTACGDESSSTAESASDPTSDPTPTAATPTQQLVSGSNGGGVVDPQATPLPDDAAVTALTTGLDDGLAADVAEAAAAFAVPDGQELYGAVVAIGCTPPEEVGVTGSGDDVLVTARKPQESPSVQCLVPVTTVALVTVDE